MIDEERINAEIDAALAAMEDTKEHQRAYLRGVREALGWVIGETEPPVTEEA